MYPVYLVTQFVLLHFDVTKVRTEAPFIGLNGRTSGSLSKHQSVSSFYYTSCSSCHLMGKCLVILLGVHRCVYGLKMTEY